MPRKEHTNEDRAEAAYRTLLVYQQRNGDPEDIEASIVDLMADLLHLCDEYGMNQDDVQRISRHHYNAEKWEATA